MFRRLNKIVTLAALVGTLGVHWAVLQSIAWSAMLADNWHSGSLRTAVVRTFDGQHPCGLCKGIAEGKRSEQRKEFKVELPKLEFPPLAVETALIPPARLRVLIFSQTLPDTAAPAPPTPPPRLFPA